MNSIDYVKKLRKLIPEDEKITNNNILQVFHDINEQVNINEILRSEMMIISIITLLKMLYIEELIDIDENFFVFWKNGEKTSQPKLLSILKSELVSKDNVVSKQIFEDRKVEPNMKYFQSFNTYQSLVRRYNLIKHYGDDLGKKIVFVGDDELFSVFYALHAVSYARILVLDIDEKILEEIEYYSNKYDLKIETRKFDVFFDEYYEEDFDIFFVSGLKKLAGLLLFIFKSSKFLRSKGEKIGYFTYYPYVENLNRISKQKDEYNYNLQKTLIDYGFLIDHLSACDEISINNTLIVKITNWIYKDKNLLLKKDVESFNLLIENEELAADPLFPFFSIKPINIARIKQEKICSKKIDEYIRIIQRFRK